MTLPLAKNSRYSLYCPSLNWNSMMRSVPICETDVHLRVLRNLRRRATKALGAAAVVRANSVRWQRKPDSISSCFLLSGLANLSRRILELRSYMLERRRVTRASESSWAMTWDVAC
jgi:hypothetical protein